MVNENTRPQLTRRQFIAVAGAVSAASALAGCSGSSAGTSQAADGTLTIGIQDEPDGMDVQQMQWDNCVHWFLNEPAVVYSDDSSEVAPALAQDFQLSDDGMTYTFTMPDGLTFSNGDTLDADAYKASFDRYLEISPYATDYDAVDSFEAVDSKTLVMHMKSIAPYVMAPLSSSYSGPADTTVANGEDPQDFNNAPVTAGPYTVESWERGSQVTLVRNDNYATNNPYVTNKGPMPFEKLVIRFIPDEFTRVSEVESGGVDIIYDVPTSYYAELQDRDDIQLYDYVQPGVSYLDLNTESGPLVDEKLRQAVAFAINRDEIKDTLDGLVENTYGFISSAQTCYSADEEEKLAGELGFDADKARQLLADAGWSDSDGDGIVEKDGQKLSLSLLVPSDRVSLKNAAPVIQEQLKTVGIDVQITEQEAAYIKQAVKDFSYDIAARNYKWADADIAYSVFTNVQGYPWNDDEVTQSLVTARETADDTERVAAYEHFQDLMATRFKAVSLFADKFAIAAKSSITGLHVTNDGRVFLHDAGVQQ